MLKKLLRRTLAVYVLAVGAIFALPPEPVHAWDCGCPPYTTMGQCFYEADYMNTNCFYYCSGYPDPYRTECQDQCFNDWVECHADCMWNCPA